VSLEWSDDVNPDNNLGQENTFVGVAHSPTQFAFQLRNVMLEHQSFRFEVDTYTIPPLLPCSQRPVEPKGPPPYSRQAPGTVAVRLPQHVRSNYPLPPGWEIAFEPENPSLAPEQEITVTVIVTAPDSFHGRQAINVNAFHNLGLAGGVTLYVERR
jgi:hypothetical protein